MNNIKSTTDGLEIIYNRYYKNNPERQIELEKMRLDDKVAREIIKIKEKYNLSTKDLADLINTEESLIESLENTDYEGDSFLLLNLIATALKMTIEFQLVSA